MSQFTITSRGNYPLGTDDAHDNMLTKGADTHFAPFSVYGEDKSVAEYRPALAVSIRELMPVHQFLNTAFVAEKKFSHYGLYKSLLFFTLQASNCFKMKINYPMSILSDCYLQWLNTIAATASSSLLNLRSSTNHVTAQRGLVPAFYSALTSSHGDHVSSGANFNNNNARTNVRSDKQRET